MRQESGDDGHNVAVDMATEHLHINEVPSVSNALNEEVRQQKETQILQDEVNEFDDLLWGVDAIAAYIKRSHRQVYHLIQSKKIPTQKVGAIHTARKSALRARLLGEEAA